MDGEHLDGLGADRVGRVELDGRVDPLAESRGRGVVVEALGGGHLLQDEAQLAQAGEALGAVRAEGHGAGERRPLEEIPGGGAGRAVEAVPAELAHEVARLPRPADALENLGGVRRRHVRAPRGLLEEEIGRIDREEGRAEEGRLGDAVVAVGDGAQAEQELPVKRILEEERAAPGGVGDARLVEPGEEQAEAPGRHGEHGDVAVADGPGPAVERVDDLVPARLDQPAEIAGEGLALEGPVLVDDGLRARREVEGQDVDGHRGRPAASGDQGLVEHPARRGIEGPVGETPSTRSKRSLSQSMSGGTLRKLAESRHSRAPLRFTTWRTASYMAMSARRKR